MSLIKGLLQQEQLSAAFEADILPYYEQLATHVAAKHDEKGSTLLVAVNGAQGTGKSTLALFLQAYLKTQDKRAAVLSIDDLYYSYSKRQQLAKDIHPLLQTRGVPGTHELVLGQSVINQLLVAKKGGSVLLPAFDKAQDDRKLEGQWPSVEGAVDVIFLEGWCVGATAMSPADLVLPINPLEADEDAEQGWRSYMNEQLNSFYQPFFNQFDLLVMLKAPSFDCVRKWRALQEKKLARKMHGIKEKANKANNGASNAPTKGLMDTNALNRFMMHYERLTTHMLNTMPTHANVLIALAQDHSIQQVSYRDED
ncbi:MAG: D-glycerate 3-kinase [Methylophilaceae bacterium]|jgi:D-glycerate 3-kinase